MIKCAIFDLDGTIIDSSDMWKNLGNNYLTLVGKTPVEDLAERLSEMSLLESAIYFRREYRIPYSTEEIMRQLTRLCERFYAEQVTAKSGALRLISTLRQRCIRMSVATAGDVRLAKSALTRFGITDSFAGIVSCTDYGAKTSPEVFFAAADLIYAIPEETVVFEDSLHAVKTAKNAGFVTAAVRDISEPNQSALSECADFYAEDLSEYAGNIGEILSFRRQYNVNG